MLLLVRCRTVGRYKCSLNLICQRFRHKRKQCMYRQRIGPPRSHNNCNIHLFLMLKLVLPCRNVPSVTFRRCTHRHATHMWREHTCRLTLPRQRRTQEKHGARYRILSKMTRQASARPGLARPGLENDFGLIWLSLRPGPGPALALDGSGLAMACSWPGPGLWPGQGLASHLGQDEVPGTTLVWVLCWPCLGFFFLPP